MATGGLGTGGLNTACLWWLLELVAIMLLVFSLLNYLLVAFVATGGLGTGG